jgi:hypothetical protein
MSSSIPTQSTKVIFAIHVLDQYDPVAFVGIIFVEPDFSGDNVLFDHFNGRLDALVWGVQKIKEWRLRGGTGILELQGIPELGQMNPRRRNR